MLTIDGSGFISYDANKNVYVTIGGQACKIVEKSNIQIKCITPPQKEAYVVSHNLFPGGHGFLRSVFKNTNNISKIANNKHFFIKDIPTQ